jgi:sugar lactone lactonase YvrE
MNTIFVLIFLLQNLSFPNLLLNRIFISCGYERTWLNSHSSVFVDSQPNTYEFVHTGSLQNFTVPIYASSVFVDIYGAAGGSQPNGVPGYGARVQTTIPVNPGDVLHIFIGGQGTTSFVSGSSPGPIKGGWNGGGRGYDNSCIAPGSGGGGASDIRIGGTSLSDRVVVAGGGGGYYGGANCPNQKGGDGGFNGEPGFTAGCGWNAGLGGSQSSGGSAGTPTETIATPGTLGAGGNGGISCSGGGGGGFYGGGGGCSAGGAAPGGGGSSHSTGFGSIYTSGYKQGQGYLSLTFFASPTSLPSSQPSRQPTSLPTLHPRSFDNVGMKLVAGTSTSGYSGDGDPATSAQIRSFIPWIDNYGSIYIPDDTSRRIRKVNPSGIISTFGGTGTPSLAGVSGPIGSVSFWTPYSIVANVGGTILYICDVRYVWKYEFSTGIAVPFAHSISLGPGFAGDDGPASSAQLSSPLGIWLTTTDVLYIADTDNQRIRKVSTGGIITTVAGSGPTGQNTGSYSGDNGPATAAKLKNPTSVYMDPIGNLFIADRDNGRIRKVAAANNIITTFAGSGTLTPFNGENIPRLTANINLPADVKGDSLGNIYIADGGNCLVRIVDTREMIWTLFGLGIGSCGFTSTEVSPRGSKINSPNGIWLDSVSNIYFSDYNSIHRSFVVSSPTSQPSRQPTGIPTSQPSNQPSTQPSSRPSLQTTYYFQFTGFIQNLTVPSYFNSMTVDITGAAGGSFTGSPGCNGGCFAGTRGYGSRVQSTLPVTPGSVLHIYVGGQGGASLGLPGTGGDGGWNGGGRGNVRVRKYPLRILRVLLVEELPIFEWMEWITITG